MTEYNWDDELILVAIKLLNFVHSAKASPVCIIPYLMLQALGDYTQAISNFSVFPHEPKEGRMGSYWYHEDTQAFFDDSDHYKMIRAMCRLSCSVCDKMEQPAEGPRRRGKFRNIEQLKGHLFHQHRMLMCSLCLEGRKVAIIKYLLLIFIYF